MILMPIYTFFTHPIILEQNAAELRGIYPKRLNKFSVVQSLFI
jgi:hypothetical protein